MKILKDNFVILNFEQLRYDCSSHITLGKINFDYIQL